MRTTLTIDDDLMKRIERLRSSRSQSLKAVVNEALREGLNAIETPRPVRRRQFTKPVQLGECLVRNLDDISEVLAVAEGDARK